MCVCVCVYVCVCACVCACVCVCVCVQVRKPAHMHNSTHKDIQIQRQALNTQQIAPTQTHHTTITHIIKHRERCSEGFLSLEAIHDHEGLVEYRSFPTYVSKFSFSFCLLCVCVCERENVCVSVDACMCVCECVCV